MALQHKIEEKQLIQRLSKDDEMAFEILFYRYRGKVGNFLKKSLPYQSDLEENVHEVFLRVWMNRKKIDSNYHFGPYLFKIAKNLIVDELRKKAVQLVYLQEGPFNTDIGLNDTEAKIEDKDLQSWFKSILEKLPQKRREIFEMNRFDDLSYKEIAQKLNISENTVDTQIRRTLQFFRSELGKLRTFFFLLF